MNVVLISCVKTKRALSAPARDLYNSTLFSAMRAYAETLSDDYYILSAKYGLLNPGDVIEYYDLTLNNMRAQERQAWSERVLDKLTSLVPPHADITIIAGEKYFEYLVPTLESRGHKVFLPLRGVQMFFRVPRLRELLRDAS